MISIIICSRFQSISKELKDNIENTVGVVHEIICIDFDCSGIHKIS